VSPANGRTRIRLEDDDRPPGSEIVMAPIVAVSAILIGVTGAVVSDVTGSNLWATVAALLTSGTFFSSTYLWARLSFRKQIRQRADTLRGLMARLGQHVQHSEASSRRLPHSASTPDS